MSNKEKPSAAHILGLFVVLVVVWAFWSGHFKGLVPYLGLASCVLVVYLSARMGIIDEEGQPLSWGVRPLLYLPWLTVEVVKANIDVALRVLGLRPVDPAYEWLPVEQETDLGRVLYADSITLTPGTVSIELEPKQVLVHALSRDGLTDLRGGEMSRRVKALEGSSR